MRNKLTPKQTLNFRLKRAVFVLSMAALFGLSYFIWMNLGWNEESAANPGKNGSRTITSVNTIVNEYTTLSSSVSAGATSLSVASSSLNANGRFSGNLSSGDLILIIQMQGASISTSNNSSYGSISNYNSCGRYEFARVSAVPNGTSITVANALKNAYTSSGRVQIIRVPRYSSLTINNGASITCPDWNGTTGGVIAVESASTVVINGSINADGKGFRGGVVEQNTTTPGSPSLFRTTNASDGAEKGESIAGLASSLSNGQYGRGAPANGGGGGNAHNCAGGGGANAGVVASWTGTGNPDNSNPNWITAWNLESPGFASTTSSGGGRGGYSFSANDANELTRAPGHSDWGGDNRLNGGGLGGRPLDYSGGRVFMGGGGGAGDSNNSTGTPGGRGGGIIFILAKNNVTGSGTVTANGASVTTQTGHDGAGGGGGGGAVLIYNNAGATSSISVSARGGNGGSQNLSWTEAEGAGGGGGGGYVAITNLPAITINVSGGNNGTSNSPSVTNFTPNGGTRGGPGSTASLPSNYNPYSASSNPLPVELVYFKAENEEYHVQLSWQTAAEKNNDFFAIERSGDGYAFEEIDRVQGAGNSSIPRNYTFSDMNPLDGTSYYRLRQVDYDGKFEVFQPRAVNRESGPAETQFRVTKIGPVPFRDQLSMELEADASGNVNFELFTNDGKLVWSDSRELQQGPQRVDLQPQAGIPGIYLLRVTAASGKTSVSRLVKQ